MILEVKQDCLRSGKAQLKSYTHATGAPLAAWSNGTRTVVWHRKNPNYFVEIPHLPAASQTIEDISGQPWTVETLIEKETHREIEGRRARSLQDLIGDLEDEVLANAGVDACEEVFKLIFAKLYGTAMHGQSSSAASLLNGTIRFRETTPRTTQRWLADVDRACARQANSRTLGSTGTVAWGQSGELIPTLR